MRWTIAARVSAGVIAIALVAAVAPASDDPRAQLAVPVASVVAPAASGVDPGTRARALGATECADASGALCGVLRVPHDWRVADTPTLLLAFKFYRHTRGSTPASAATTLFLGQDIGDPMIADGDPIPHRILGRTFGDRDVLVIDRRGSGLSEAIDCPAMQHGSVDIASSTFSCALHLGNALDDYGAAYSARDANALRLELGIPQVDIIALGYGGMDAMAYTARFGASVRSVVFASSIGPASFNFLSSLHAVSALTRRTIIGLCSGSAECRDRPGSPLDDLAWAARSVTENPLRGVAVDDEGEARDVKVTQATLVYASHFEHGPALPAWLAAAASAYRAGDPVPLLRIGAEVQAQNARGSSGAAEVHSAAAFFAATCADNATPPWSPGLLDWERSITAERVARGIPPLTLWPWSMRAMLPRTERAWETELSLCSLWPDVPDAEVPLEPHTTLPDVPVLAVVGTFDADAPAENTIRDAQQFRNSHVLRIDQVPHNAAQLSCGPLRIQQFMTELGDVQPCAWAVHWYVQPSFPVAAADISTDYLTRSSRDESTTFDRRVAASVWRTVLDSWIQTTDRDFGRYYGLRGGTVVTTQTLAGYSMEFDNYRFVEDVAVTGRLLAPFGSDPVSVTVRVTGPRGPVGILTLLGRLGTNRDGEMSIAGTLAGHVISLTTSTL